MVLKYSVWFLGENDLMKTKVSPIDLLSLLALVIFHAVMEDEKWRREVSNEEKLLFS